MKRILLVLAFVTSLVACGGSDTPPPPPPPSEGSATIDATGGTVNGPDGVRLMVPAGALGTATTLRIARDGSGAPELGGAKAISSIYSVTPHGIEFAESARITIPFKTADVTPGIRPVLMRAQPGGRWEALATDVHGETISAADTPGLSYYAVGTCYTTRDAGVSGPDPLLYCPNAHTLELRLYDGNGALLPVVRNGSGVAQPVMTITAPTNLRFSLLWTRPPGTQRSDRVWMQIFDAGLQPSQQPLLDFAVNRDFTQTFTITIDPATVPGAGAAGGKVIRLRASVVYTTEAYYPGCFCLKPASWSFTTEIPVRVQYGGPQPVITQQPQNQSVVENQSATFSVTATGANLTYQWYGQTVGATDPVPIPGATSPTLTLPAVPLSANGLLYYVRICGPQVGALPPPCVNSNFVTLNVARFTQAPAFTVQPRSITVTEGETASFNATATGTPAPTIEWTRLRTTGIFETVEPVPGCNPVTGSGGTTSSTCTLPPQPLSESGARYLAGASNTAGSVGSNVVTVTVLPRPVAPTITTPAEPADRTVQAGGSVNWTVGASGTAPLSYAWRTIAPIGGVVNDGGVCDQSVPAGSRGAATLNLTNVPLACNGYRFQLVVSNSVAPAASSRAALLTVTPPPAAPTITTPLQDRSVLDGTQVTFSVAATGTPATFTYAWTLDGAAVPEVVSGCTSSSPTCTFTARLPQTGKTVRVGVSNGTAPDAASSATLTVTTNDVGASITQQPVNASTVEGGSAGFTVGVAGTPTPSVQWETSPDGITWTSAGTGTSFTITGATLAQNGLQVRAQVSNTIATPTGPRLVPATSNIVTLTVTAATTGMVLYVGDFSGGGSIDGVGKDARLNFPEGLAADASGNLYVAQTNGDRVARIAPGAVVTTIYNAAVDGRVPGSSNVGSVALGPNGDLYAAGVSYCGLYRIAAPASATPAVTVMNPVGCSGSLIRGLAVDSQGRAYLSLTDTHAIFRVANAPVSGNYPTSAFAGSGAPFQPGGYLDATGTAARFNAPRGTAFAANGDLFVADSDNHVIRRVTPLGEVTTFAGTAGQAATVDDTGAAARFNTPAALAFDAVGNLYVLDLGASPQALGTVRVRRVTPAGDVTTPVLDATAEAQALAAPGQEPFAANIRGIAVLGSNRIALSSGNAILLRTLP